MAKNGKTSKTSTAPRRSAPKASNWQQILLAVVGIIIIITMVITLVRF